MGSGVGKVTSETQIQKVVELDYGPENTASTSSTSHAAKRFQGAQGDFVPPNAISNLEGKQTLAERVEALEWMVQQQAQQLQQMTKALEGVQKDVRRTVSVMQYNILASYLGKNTQPWFLYGADISPEERERIFARFNERGPDGTPKHRWPDYATGILRPEEITAVEQYDTFFRWEFRRQKLLEQIEIMDPDVLSLVELDDHGFFAECLCDEWDSVFRKRPRASSADGCGIFWRRSKFECLASEGFDMVDGNDDKGREKRDRSCVMVLLKWRVAGPHILPLVVVSTHLAKDPYNKAQTAIRVRQVTQIMDSLTKFTSKHKARHCPVVLLGDLNARHFGEIRGIARTAGALMRRALLSAWMARRAPHGKDGKEESVVDWMRLLWPILPEVGEPGKDFGSTAEEDGEVRARPRRRRSPSALAYVAAFGTVLGHLCMILAITWMSFKFSEQHAKLEDPLRQLRYYLTLLLLPIVLYTTGKNWHAGTHFPMTASSSLQVLRNRPMEPPASELTGGDVYCMLANGIFFCYLFLWNLVLLLQRHRDRDVFDPSAHLLVPLCVGSALLRAKPTLLCFLFFGMVCLLFACLLLLSGLLATIALHLGRLGRRNEMRAMRAGLDRRGLPGATQQDQHVWQIKGEPIHKFLWGATDVNTGPTSVTKARHCRIDVVQYLSSHMEVLDVMPVPKLEPGEVIPNEDHPSDHFPVFVTFTLKDSYEKHRDCARAWLECVAGREKVHPLTDEELRDAFEFFDRDRQECIHRRDLEEACLDLRCNFSVDVPKLLVDCFPNKQISFQNFLRAYEASLGSDRMRAVGDLECAFRYFAGEKDSIEIDTLEAAFREITPISFSDDEVKDMIGRVAQDGSPYGKASVHLKDFCEVVCKATFPNRQVSPESGVTGTESETWAARNATKEISTRLTKLHKTVSGQGLHRNVSKSSNVSEMPIRIDKHLAPPLVH
ncbi:ccr4 [Symbiodinium sp. CCMP2592]|nr:ccr4 [Symbiodinium sp. CCMP2592]